MSIVQGIKNKLQRAFKITWDVDHIQNGIYSDAAGAQKGIDIQPVPKKATLANEQVPFGAYIKIGAATGTYNMDCIGKEYDATKKYRIGNVVTVGADVYVAALDVNIPEAFDSNKWVRMADKVISGIPHVIGDTVSTGRYHNSISVAGFLIDDDSSIKSKR